MGVGPHFQGVSSKQIIFMLAHSVVLSNYRISLKTLGFFVCLFFTKLTWFTGRNTLGAICTHQPFIYL